MKETKLKIIFTVIAALLCVLCACTAAAPDPATDAPAAGTRTETAAVTAGTVTETAYESETEDTEMKLKENITFKASKEIIIRPFSWAPRVYGTNDGELIAGYETSDGIKTAKSGDGGKTWYGEANASFAPDLNCANVNFFFDGERLYLAYRAVGNTGKGLYTSLRVSVSDDNGKSWTYHSKVAEYTDAGGGRGVWEPYLGLLNGRLICMYANDHPSVTNYQNIEYLVWNGTEWTDRTVISDGSAHRSRDGMPVWCESPDGGYLCAIESTTEHTKGYPFVIKLIYSPDGVNWSEPRTVYTPSSKGSKAAAPGVAFLPDGRLAISFQTDEDATVKGDNHSVMKIMFSDGTDARKLNKTHFSPPENIFGTPDGESSVWAGIFYRDGVICASAGTKNGSSLKIANVFCDNG